MGFGNDVTGMPSFVFLVMLAMGIPSDPLSPRPHEYTRFSVRKMSSINGNWLKQVYDKIGKPKNKHNYLLFQMTFFQVYHTRGEKSLSLVIERSLT